MIVALTLQSSQGTTALSDWFRDVLLKLVPAGSPAAKWIYLNIRHLGHIPEYFLLGLTVYGALAATMPGKRTFLWTLALCAGISLGDEVLKELLPTRHFDIWDMPMDLIGYTLGAALGWAIGRI